MKPSHLLNIHREEIRRLVLLHHAKNPRVFGSVIENNDTEQSDLDILVEPTEQMTLLDIGAIRHHLIMMLKIPVDVVTPMSLSPRFRQKVLDRAIPL